MAEVEWVKEIKNAFAEAKSAGKPILLDFFNPG